MVSGHDKYILLHAQTHLAHQFFEKNRRVCIIGVAEIVEIPGHDQEFLALGHISGFLLRFPQQNPPHIVGPLIVFEEMQIGDM